MTQVQEFIERRLEQLAEDPTVSKERYFRTVATTAAAQLDLYRRQDLLDELGRLQPPLDGQLADPRLLLMLLKVTSAHGVKPSDSASEHYKQVARCVLKDGGLAHVTLWTSRN